MNKITLTWEDVEDLAFLAAKRIPDISPLCLYGVPRGGVYCALLIKNALKKLGRESFISNQIQEAHFLVDDIVDSGATKQKYTSKYSTPFIALIEKGHPIYSGCWVVFPWEEANQETGVEENIRRVLEYIGEDPNREGLIETPKRVVRSFEKLYGGYAQNPQDILKTFTEGACDEMVLLKNIELYSTCEHHMLPFYGKAHIAYIPNGKVVGVSKLARLLEIYARRLQIQERIGQQITEALDTYLKPKGSACIIEAQHFCMVSRGVEKQNSIMVTSSLTGVFRNSIDTRNELLSLLK
jgi:GTP cyclohydrolase I